METASFNGLIETILFIFAFYYIMKFLGQLFLPMMAQKMMEKASEQFQQQQKNQQASNTKTTEKPKEKKIVGEYVDFEEID
jgi:hypothetical protein